MVDSQNTPDADGVPTVKNFSDLGYPKYRIDPWNQDLYNDPDVFESPEHYEPGGFCPIDLSLGDSPSFINERFEVIYKLGWGGYGTVWLCYEEAVKKWRAVKVGAASETEERSGDVLLHSTMAQHGVGVAEALENHILLPLETFWIDSTNGKHLCTVLPLLGPRLSDWVGFLEEEEPDQARRIISQMVQGMDFLHRHGICHGDFRPQNMLMQLKTGSGSLEDMGFDEMVDEILYAPQMVDILLRNSSPSPHAPKTSYSSFKWDKDNVSRFVSDKIAIVDFGEAYLSNDPNPRIPGIPGSYAAPEVVLGVPKGIGADIWALARSILEFRTHTFHSNAHKTRAKVLQMEEFVGPCPATFRREIQKRLCARFADDEDWMDPESYYIFKGSLPGYQALEKEYDHHVERFLHLTGWHSCQLSREEILSLGDLLRNMFRWRPEERWPTDKILAHRWFSEHHQSAVLYNLNGTIKSKNKSTEIEKEPEISPSAAQGIDAADPQTEPTEPTVPTVPIAQTTPTKSVYPAEPTESVNPADPAVNVDNTASPEAKTETQPVNAWCKAAWISFGIFTMVIYFSGVIAMISFFLAHMLANQPGFYADRLGHGSTSNDTAGKLGPVIQHVVITLIIQA